MPWNTLANNQIVSFNNLRDAVATGQFTALANIPISDEEITKTDASTYVNCWTGYSLFANKASNQLIAKRDLVTTSTTTTTTSAAVSYIYAGTANTYTSSSSACANKTCGRSYWLAAPTWSIGSTVYDNVGLTIKFNGGGNWIAVATSSGYCSGGWAAVQVDSNGVILSFVTC